MRDSINLPQLIRKYASASPKSVAMATNAIENDNIMDDELQS